MDYEPVMPLFLYAYDSDRSEQCVFDTSLRSQV
jgi:hypothetical protein